MDKGYVTVGTLVDGLKEIYEEEYYTPIIIKCGDDLFNIKWEVICMDMRPEIRIKFHMLEAGERPDLMEFNEKHDTQEVKDTP